MCGLHIVEFSYVLVCLMVSTKFVLSQESCGIVKGKFIYNNKGLSCLLEFTPSAYFMPYSSPSTISWVRVYYHTERKVIDPREFPTEFKTGRYVQAGTSILIHNVTSRDNGNYSLYCWIDRSKVLPMTKSWRLNVPTSTTTTTTIREDSSPAAALNEETTPPIDSSAIIVVALCTVVVVLIVAVTAIVIVRKRKPKDGTGRLMSASGENSESCLREPDANALYNEIGYVDLKVDSKVETTSMHGSRFDLTCSGESPSLPKRPNNMLKNINAPSTSRASENEYAIIRDNSSIRKSKPTNSDIRVDKNDEYAKVIPKSKRSSSLQTGLLENGPMYAKVIPKSERRASENGILDVLHVPRDTAISDGNVKHCQSKEGPTYCNVESADNHAENKKLPTKSKEPQLEYAILAHVTPESDVVHGEEARELENKDCVQYAQIDFEKKAFVAPIRKAPSSWYKRRFKKKNKS